MSARTFAEWQAYCSIEPFGPQAGFWQAALIACLLANIHRKEKSKPFKIEDFLPKGMMEQESIQVDTEQTAAMLKHNFETYAARQKAKS